MPSFYDQVRQGIQSGGGMAAANPLDPNQQSRWLGGIMGQQPFDLYDPKNLAQLRTIFEPYFQMAQQNLMRQQGTSLNQASRGANAYSAAHGYDNNAALLNRARSGVFGAYAPQFGQQQENQLQTPLNAGAQSQQFGLGQHQFDINSRLGLLGMGIQQQNNESQNSFNFWRDAFPGLLKAGATAGIAASDIRLKKNIHLIAKIDGLNLYGWEWNDRAKKLGITDPTIGLLAQEAPQHAVIDNGEYLMIDYARL